jgi:hypothetical protein
MNLEKQSKTIAYKEENNFGTVYKNLGKEISQILCKTIKWIREIKKII